MHSLSLSVSLSSMLTRLHIIHCIPRVHTDTHTSFTYFWAYCDEIVAIKQTIEEERKKPLATKPFSISMHKILSSYVQRLHSMHKITTSSIFIFYETNRESMKWNHTKSLGSHHIQRRKSMCGFACKIFAFFFYLFGFISNQ